LSRALAGISDLGGSLAELLWEKDQAAFQLQATGKLKTKHDGSLWQFLACSRSLQHALILGIKERRATVDHKLYYDEICENVRQRFRAPWKSLRILQFTNTGDEDMCVAQELVRLHMSAA